MSADNDRMMATLLLADESTAIQRVIELTFADEDVRIVVVVDGDAAVAHIEEQPPDIVLVDVGVLGMNGYEVASYIKHQPRLAHIPVLLLTGAFEPVDQRKANDAGCDGVLSKPFEPQLLVSRVKELLERSRGGVSNTGLARPTSLSMVPKERADLATTVHTDGDSAASESLGDFFEKLDAAFANLPVANRGTASQDEESADGIWDLELPATSDTDLPSFLAPSNDAGGQSSPQPGPRPVAGPLSLSSLAPEKPAVPPLAEALAAPLAAEYPGTEPARTVTAPPPTEMDDLIERVAQRVLDRLSDRVVRETAAELVASIAERLVREEIERIRAAIKNL